MELKRAITAWRTAFAVCAAAAAIPLLVTYRLPMADLPQHAVQLTVWKFFSDACYRFGDTYELNWATPYLLGTVAMRAIAAFLSVHATVKLVVYVTILLLPLILKRIAEFSGVDPWLALLGFPLAFGFSFYWGFLNFSLVVPLALLVILTASRAAAEGGRSAKLGILSMVLAAAHALAYVFAILIALPLLAWRRLWRQVVAILLPLPILLLWAQHAQSQQARARVPWEWSWGSHRLLHLFDLLLSGGNDLSALLASVLLIAIALLTGVGLTRERWRLLPFAVTLACALFWPLGAFGQTFLYPRLMLFLPATALLAAGVRETRFPRTAARALIVVFVLVWMGILTARFASFHRDADGFDRIVDNMPSNQRVLLLNVVQSDVVSGMPFLHFSGYYLERKGGVIGWSFASNFPMMLRYRHGFVPGVPPIVTHDPRTFDWNQHANFDFFIVRAPGDMTPLLFRQAGQRVRLLRRSGLWWLYERVDRPRRDECPPLVRDRHHDALLQRAATIE